MASRQMLANFGIGTLAEQRGLERARDGVAALAGLGGIADDHDLLAGASEVAQVISGRAPAAVVEPVAKRRIGEDLAQARPVCGAGIEQRRRDAAEAEA